jgi:membrane protease YdiL (CAAX protease family)
MSKPGRSVGAFFLLTFAFTWGLQLPGILALQDMLPGAPRAYLPFAMLGVFGPLVAATALAWRQGGAPAVKALYAPLLQWRVHVGWYAAALLPAALLCLLLGLLNLAGRDGPIAYFPPAAALVAAVVISIAEEVGWRGYALPRMQRRFGAFGASALLGVLWYVWHIPMFIGLAVPLDLVLVMLLYFIGASLVFTWIYNGSGGSLLLAVVTHLAAHLNNSHRALPAEVVPLVAHAIVYAGLGLFVSRAFLPGRPGTARPLQAPDRAEAARGVRREIVTVVSAPDPA